MAGQGGAQPPPATDDYGRPPFPGIRKDTSKIVAEHAYTQRCNAEASYYKRCKEWAKAGKADDVHRMHRGLPDPPSTWIKQPIGKVGVFDVTQCRSHTEAKWMPAPISTAGSSTVSRGGGGSSTSSSPARGGRGQRGAEAEAAQLRQMANTLTAVSGSYRFGTTQASAGPRPGSVRSISTAPSQWEPDFVLPKYAHTQYSMSHMKELEKPTVGFRSAKNLQRVLSLPVNTLRVQEQ